MMKGGRVPGQKPRAIFCYICGQGYGTQSIMIHVKACQKKWQVQQEQLPPERRRKCPEPPMEFLQLTGQGKLTGDEIDDLNEVGFGHYKETALEHCPNCNRTFNPDAFTRHQRICTPDNPLNPLPPKKLGEARSVKRESIKEPDNQLGSLQAKNNAKRLSATANVGPAKAPAPPAPKPGSKTNLPASQTQARKPPSSNTNNFEGLKQPSQDAFPAKPQLKGHTTGLGGTKAPSEVAKKPVSGIKAGPGPAKPAPAAPAPYKPPSSAMDEVKIKGGGANANFDRMLAMAEKQMASLDLVPCAKCGRKFVSDRIAKHQKACKVNSKPKKVKVFHKKITAKEKEKMGKNKTSKWKLQHQELVAQMKYMRQMKDVQEKGGNIRDLPPPPPTVHGDYLECPYCARKFNATAHEKHVNICKNVINKPKAVPNRPQVQPKAPTSTVTKHTSAISGAKPTTSTVGGLSKTSPLAKPGAKYK